MIQDEVADFLSQISQGIHSDEIRKYKMLAIKVASRVVKIFLLVSYKPRLSTETYYIIVRYLGFILVSFWDGQQSKPNYQMLINH